MKLGYKHLTVFGDSNLAINMVKIIYTPTNKILNNCTKLVWDLLSKFLYFNLTFIHREMNLAIYKLATYFSHPDRMLLP